jgi:alpha-L-rhamnosidase
MLYQTYGELDLLEEANDEMQRYVSFLAAKTTNGTLAYGLGDWESFDTGTPLGITATFGYYQAQAGMQTIAAAPGRTSDSLKYVDTISNLVTSSQSQFTATINGTYAYGSGSQASNAIAIDH